MWVAVGNMPIKRFCGVLSSVCFSAVEYHDSGIVVSDWFTLVAGVGVGVLWLLSIRGWYLFMCFVGVGRHVVGRHFVTVVVGAVVVQLSSWPSSPHIGLLAIVGESFAVLSSYCCWWWWFTARAFSLVT